MRLNLVPESSVFLKEAMLVDVRQQSDNQGED